MQILIYTLGCPKNFNDSQVAAGIMERAGHKVIMANDDMSEQSQPILTEEALAQVDAVMVNTCGFINDAKTESIETILDMAQLGKMLIVSGCLTQRYGEELYKEMPEIDIFLGVNEYECLPEILAAYDGRRRMEVSDYTTELETDSRKLPEVHYTATIKISEGCNNQCTFCAIPGIRGPYRSRPKELIIAEAEKLAKAGTKEIILIAQDTTTYGKDIYGKYALAELLEDLCKIEDIRWIRLMYAYEDRLTDELLEVMGREEKIVKYIDIPLQHISDPVLLAMKRRSDEDGIRQRLSFLRRKVPGVHIRTTLIVGFPGESEHDFEKLLDFVEEQQFARLGVFKYSPEEGTEAAQLPGQIDEEVKEKRLQQIMDLQRNVSLANNQSKIGKTMEVLVEGPDEEAGTYLGRTAYDAPGIDNGIIFTSRANLVPGDMVQVFIEDAYDYDLVGRQVD